MEKTIDFGNGNYLKVKDNNITIFSSGEEFHFKSEDFFKYFKNPESYRNVVQEFEEYCIAKEKKFYLMVKDKFSGKELIYSNDDDVRLKEKYTYAANVFINECSDL